MVIPLADCCNHFIIDNQYEMHNRALNLKYLEILKEGKKKEEVFDKSDLNYFTECKMRVNCLKHFEEDGNFEDVVDPPFKTKRYIKKIKMRDYCKNLSREEFLYDPKVKDKQIWELKYISTSEDEDNDTTDSEEEEEEEDEENGEKKEEKKAAKEQSNGAKEVVKSNSNEEQKEELKEYEKEENKNGTELS